MFRSCRRTLPLQRNESGLEPCAVRQAASPLFWVYIVGSASCHFLMIARCFALFSHRRRRNWLFCLFYQIPKTAKMLLQDVIYIEPVLACRSIIQKLLLASSHARSDDGFVSNAGAAPTRVATVALARHWSGPAQFRPIPAPDRVALFSALVQG